MSRKIQGSWEKSRDGEVHSPEGIDNLRETFRAGQRNFFYTIAETMWRYDGMDDDPRFEQMNMLSRDTMPERWMLNNGQATVFDLLGSRGEGPDKGADKGGPLVCLPMVEEKAINIYGFANEWRAVPVGWSETAEDTNPEPLRRIHDRVLSYDDSVIIRNDRYSGSDKAFIDCQIDMLVDNLLTVNQLQLLVRSPYVFNTTKEQELTAKNFFLDICQGRPAIFRNRDGDDPTPVVEKSDVKIDPAVFEIYDRVVCNILEYLGFPCIPVTKRAQQSVSEVQSNDDKIAVRRHDKQQQRERGWGRVNKMFGTHVTVVSVIDEQMEMLRAEAEQEQKDIKGGSDE